MLAGMAICDWPPDERPREKLLEKGAAALSGRGVVGDLAAHRDTGHFGRRPGAPGTREFSLAAKTGGFGSPAILRRARSWVGAICGIAGRDGIARRQMSETLRTGPSLASPRTTRDYLSSQLRDLEYEVFCCLYLDKRHRLIEFEKLFRGTIDGRERAPAGNRQAGSAAQCGRRDHCAQSSFRRG